MTAHHSRRFRLGLLLVTLAAVGVAFHQDIIGRVAYAVEKGKREASQEQLAKVEGLSDLFRSVARQVKPAVVTIRTTSAAKASSNSRRRQPNIDPRDIPEPLRPFFEGFGDREFEMPSPPTHQSSGSGVIIDAERGYVLTNYHVVSEDEDAKTRIDVTLPDGRRLEGKVLGTDSKTDLALVQIKADRLHAAPLGDSTQMDVGDWVIAVGAPFGLEQTVTQGIISATGRSNLDIARYGNFLQTDAAINPGNSGGPLVNMRGEVIGINTAIATNGLVAGYMGVGFAIPSNMAKDVLKYLEKGEEVVRGYLGVQIKGFDAFEPGFEKTFGLPEGRTGVLIEDFAKIPGISQTPAQKAGLKVDDVILEYAGRSVKSGTELQNLVANTEPGQKVNLLIWRDGKEITIPVTIERQPKNFFAQAEGRGRDRGRGQRDEEEEETESATIDSIGITVEPLTEATARRYGWTDEPDTEGMLVVTKVDPVGEAAALRIGPGDLIVSVQGRPVKSVSELRKTLSKEALAQGVRIKVRNLRLGSQTVFLQISP